MQLPRGNIDIFMSRQRSRSSLVQILLFVFLGGLLGSSGHHFGALLSASGDLLGIFGGSWDLLDDPLGLLWGLFAAPWAHLATRWVHFGGIFCDFGSNL